MPEYIEREALIKKINSTKAMARTAFPKRSFCVSDVLDCIYTAPTADVAEVRHGEWVIPVTKEPWREGFVGMGTNCGYTNCHTKKAPKFCEGCGARMDGKGDADDL